jgi:hypothetical protein
LVLPRIRLWSSCGNQAPTDKKPYKWVIFTQQTNQPRFCIRHSTSVQTVTLSDSDIFFVPFEAAELTSDSPLVFWELLWTCMNFQFDGMCLVCMFV